jgi:hypothetical protein
VVIPIGRPTLWRLVSAFTAVLAVLFVLGLWPSKATASSTLQITHLPVSSTFQHPCTGATVTINGTLQVITRVTLDAAGGAHFFIQSTLQNVGGFDTDGTRYRAVGGAVAVFNTNTPSDPADPQGQQEFTQVDIMNVLGQGGAGNLVFVAVFHFTNNANAAPTALVELINVGCKP